MKLRVLKQVKKMSTPPSPETFYFLEVKRRGVFYPVNSNILDERITRSEIAKFIQDTFRANRKMIPMTFAERWIMAFGDKVELVRTF